MKRDISKCSSCNKKPIQMYGLLCRECAIPYEIVRFRDNESQGFKNYFQEDKK